MPIRKNLRLDQYRKALVKQEGQTVVIEPVVDLLTLKGSLQKFALKGKSPKEILELEEEAWETGTAERYAPKGKK